MGQAVAAALATVSPDRRATSLQMMFLAGARPELPLDYVVQRLQDGKRVSSRYVWSSQGGVGVSAAFVSAHVPAHGRRQRAMPAIASKPGEGVRPADFPPALRARLAVSGFMAMDPNPNIEYRFVDPGQLEGTRPRPLHMWMRLRDPLPPDPHVQAAALAYLSDWWLGFTGIAPHIEDEKEGFYLASLNHTLWFHAPCLTNDWLLCENESPWANEGRGLSRGHIYSADGVLVASVAQDCLQARRSASTL